MRGVRGDAGMTLIEMLIVLAIVAVATGAAVMGMGKDRGRGAEAEARRLSDRLRLAADEAMVTDRPIALSWDAGSYSFVDALPNGRDRPDPLPELGARHALPSGMSLVVQSATPPLPITADGLGAPVTALLDDGAHGWRVRFDGIAVDAFPARGG